MRQQKYYEAYLEDFDKVVVYLSKNSYEGISNRFYIKDTFEHIIDLQIQSIETTSSNYNKYTLVVMGELEIGREYYVVHQHARSTILNYCGILKTDKFDNMFYYDGDDLGYVYSQEETSFALWAPTASRVKIEINKNGTSTTYDMYRSDFGVFRLTLKMNLENATYVYLIRVGGKWVESLDPYGCASIENSKRSAVVDLSKVRVKDYDLPKMESNCDAIIYETSVRDFTMQANNGFNMPGTYRGFVEENEVTLKKNTGFTYLKSLGVTHIQLMPVLDFGSIDEMHTKLHYNWGYDPVQYRVLEGSFSSDPTNPYGRIFGFTKLVEDCHKAGIRVNLDVVFNHVYDKEDHFFEKTVPNYYFQMNSNGNFSNGSYCGNDVDSKRKMCSKYIVDACKFLVKTYHVDGFRFDLMGILDYETINMIDCECRKIKPDIMLYGEGWDMPSYLSFKERASITNNAKMVNVGHFSDRFRDVVKGRTDASEVNVKGYLSGATYLLDIMKNCMVASCINEGMEPLFAHPQNVVNYVECHDNMTCWDKLKICCKEDSKDVLKERQKMMIAAILLAQGIPFIHSGQEFARTKHGLHNTYADRDEINRIDFVRRDRYQDIVDCTKDLIKIRKKYACLRYATREDVEKNVHFESIENQALVYRCEDETCELITFFNPTSRTFEYKFHEELEWIFDNKAIEPQMVNKVDIHPYKVVICVRQK